jgi:hypothetical protein
MQHGGNYGVQDLGKTHVYSDYRRCDEFLSYGFDESDLDIEVESDGSPCRISPAGSCREWRRRVRESHTSGRPSIDILYPIANCAAIWEGHLRGRSETLYRWQAELLEYLDGLPLRVMVKPLLGSLTLFAHSERLKGLKGLIVRYDLSFTEALVLLRPRVVVIDFPSNPLFESLGAGCEIFAVEDPVVPIKAAARELLSKRVHLFADAASLKAGLDGFLDGKGRGLGDDGFYRRYMVPAGDPHERVRSVLESFSDGSSQRE